MFYMGKPHNYYYLMEYCVCVNENMHYFEMCLSFILIILLAFIQTNSNFIFTFSNDIYLTVYTKSEAAALIKIISTWWPSLLTFHATQHFCSSSSMNAITVVIVCSMFINSFYNSMNSLTHSGLHTWSGGNHSTTCTCTHVILIYDRTITHPIKEENVNM